MKRANTPSFTPALILHFEGFFQCRLATDPDPSREKRGVSGDPYALAGEDDFDRVINLQLDEKVSKNYREGFPEYPKKEEFGVFVKKVTWIPKEGEKEHDLVQHPLQNSEVRLDEKSIYEMRNLIISDGGQRLAPIINPFSISITKDGVLILKRSDPLADDLEKSGTPSWKLKFGDYQNRVPIFNPHAEEVARSLAEQGVSDPNQYYQNRKDWLLTQIALETAKKKPDKVKISNWKHRVGTIERISAKPGETGLGSIERAMYMQNLWRHTIRGKKHVIQTDGIDLGAKIQDKPWEIRFWHGGWDVDLMRGYMKGWLALPIKKVNPPE